MKAVQILSRLNRFCKGKIDNYMLDFVNTAEGIAASFKPFFEDTLLTEIVDPNLVYRYKTDIDKFHLWSTDDEEKVYQIYAVW